MISKWIKGFENEYEVCEDGTVYSHKIGRIKKLKWRITSSGYFKVSLYKNGTIQNKSIHRLVAEAFIPNPENKPQVNHIDENKNNNGVKNLEWMTSSENCNYETRNERISEKQRGEKNHYYKSIDYYSNNCVRADTFREKCRRSGWKEKDFERVFSGEKCGNKKKYYYIFKGGKENGYKR